MRWFIISTLLFLTTFSNFGQETINNPSSSRNKEKFNELISQFSNKERYSVQYDKFKDITVIRTPYSNLNKRTQILRSLHISAAFVFNTDTMKEDEDYFTVFFNATGNKWSFIPNKNLYIIAGGRRLDLGEGDRTGEIDSNRTLRSVRDISVTESVNFLVSREIIEQVTNSEKVEMKLGDVEFELTVEAKQMLKNLLILGTLEGAKKTDK